MIENLKKWVWLLPLVAMLLGGIKWAVSSSVEHALREFADQKLVLRDPYIDSQHTQDQRIERLEKQYDAMMHEMMKEHPAK